MPTSRLRHLRVAAALLFVMTVGNACGFLFSKAPPPGHEQMEYFTCTESNAGPILDIVWGGLNVLGALAIASDPEGYEEIYGNASTGIVIGLAWGGVSTAAAVTGFKRSQQCRDAKLLLAQRQAQNRAPVVATSTDGAVQSVVLTPQSDTLLVGGTLQLVAAAYHSSGVVIPGRSFTWSSSNDAIASTNNAGLVTAHAPGTVTIAANTANVVGTARIVVVETRQ